MMNTETGVNINVIVEDVIPQYYMKAALCLVTVNDIVISANPYVLWAMFG